MSVLLVCGLVLLGLQWDSLTKVEATPQAGAPLVDLPIPPTFSGDREGALTLPQAKALVASHPEVLLEPARFSSLISLRGQDFNDFGIRPTDVVADVGCGSGALEFGLIREGIPFRLLYAVDVNLESIEFLGEALEALDRPETARIKPVLSSALDVCLPANSVDLMIIYNTPIGIWDTAKSHPIVSPETVTVRLVATMARALRPDGRVYFKTFCERDALKNVRPLFERGGLRTVNERFVKEDKGPVYELVLTRGAPHGGGASRP